MVGLKRIGSVVILNKVNYQFFFGSKRILVFIFLCFIQSQCASRRLHSTGIDEIPLEPLSLVIITVGGSTAPPEPLSKSPEVDAWLDRETFPNTLLNIGIRQMFLFGKAIKKRYSQLFESVQDPSDIYFLSKSTGPEITSVQGFGQSFFEDGVFANAEEFDALIPIPFTGNKPKLNFSTPLPNGNKPFRIYSVSQKELDVVFGLGSITACPNLNIREFSNEIEHVNKDFRFFESLEKAKKRIQLNESLESIAKVNNLELSSRLFEWIQAQVLSVRDPFFPPGTQVYEELKVAHEAYITASQAESNLIKIIQAPAMQLITNHLSFFIKKNGKIDPRAKKLYMLLGHNKFMIGLMMVLGLAKPKCFYNKLKYYKFGTPYNETENCPEFPCPTSNIIFEVLREAGDPSS